MKTFRIILGILAIIPFYLLFSTALTASPEFAPNSNAELIYTVVGIPILILNLWAWMYPEIIEYYFFGKEKPE